MKFDKSKVFTALNADELKVGSKGYFTDNIESLELVVQSEDYLAFGELEKIQKPNMSYRFGMKESDKSFNLFYLVKEPQEKKFRPYSNPDEMIEDFKRRYNAYGGWSGKDNPMYNPMIWVKSKTTGFRHLVTDYGDDDNCDYCNRSCIWIGSFSLVFKELLDDYTYLDGTPCGIEEE